MLLKLNEKERRMKNTKQVSYSSSTGLRILTILLVFSFSGQLFAQQNAEPQYDVLPVPDHYNIPDILDYRDASIERQREVQSTINEKRGLVRATHRKVYAAIKGEGTVSQQELAEYFRDFYFANMTQTSPRKLGEYGKLRNDFFRLYLAKSSGPIRSQILNLAYDTMSPVATGNYHPAARVNAVVLIGNLDSQRGSKTNNGFPPTPYSKALPFLLSIVEDQASPEYLKIAALVGIQRHTSLNAAGSEKDRIARLMRNLAKSSEAGGDQNANTAAYWVRRRAVQTLGFLADPANAPILKAIIVSNDEPIWLRVDALDAYSKLNFTSAAQAEAYEICKEIGKLVVNSARVETAFVDQSIHDIKEVSYFLDGQKPGGNKSDDGGKKLQDLSAEGLNSGEDFMRGKDKNKAEVPEILPVYQRKLIRQRIKTIIYVAQETVGDRDATDGLAKLIADSNNQEQLRFVKEMARILEDLMESTNVVDIRGRKKDEDENDGRTRAEKLQDAMTLGADKLEVLIASVEPQQPEAPPENQGGPTDTTSEEDSSADTSAAADENSGQ